MRRTVRAVLCLSLLLLYGCSTTTDVVGHGPFQKRKYRPGWHVDIGHRASRPAEKARIQRESIPRMDVTTLQPVEQVMTPESLTASTAAQPPISAPPPAHSTSPGRNACIRVIAPVTNKIVKPPDERTTDEPRRWNRMALVSGAFLIIALLVALTGGGAVMGYIFTFSVLTGIIGLLLAIKHNERGKGIAIAAIAIPIAILVAAVVSLNTW